MTHEQQRIAIETVSFCPHCRSGNDPVLKDTTWSCGVRFNDALWRTKECYKRNLELANDRIKRLEEMYEGEPGERPDLLGSNVMGLLKRELNSAQQRIKRLEEAYAAKDKQLSNLLHICRDNDIEVSSYDLIHGKEAKP